MAGLRGRMIDSLTGDYSKDMRQLRQVPARQRGLEWAITQLYIHCRYKREADRAWRLLEDIRRCLDDDLVWDSKVFEQELDTILTPLSLTFHGYVKKFIHRNAGVQSREIEEVFKVLSKLGYVGFINSGTLLGQQRQGSFLGHDDDVDLAIVLPIADEGQVVPAFARLRDQLTQQTDWRVSPPYYRDMPVVKIWPTQASAQIDLFPCWIRDGQVYIWPYCPGTLAQGDILPLTTGHLAGKAVPIPQNPEAVLVQNYGADWRTPDPHFQFDWQPPRAQFQTLLRTYFLHKLRYLLLRPIRAIMTKRS